MDMSLRIYARSISELLLPAGANQKTRDVYTFQRGLVEAGLLTPDRPGPGGGTRATPETVGKLMVAALCCSGRDSTANEAAVWLNMGRARGDRDKPDPLFKAKTFGDFVISALSMPALADRILSIEVERNSRMAAVRYYVDPALEETGLIQFSVDASHAAGFNGLRRSIEYLDGLAIKQLAAELAN